jgi:hypothetical protein
VSSKLDERGQNISEAFSRAISLIDEARELRASSESSPWRLLLWKAAAEAEYLAFKISFQYDLIDYDPNRDTKRTNDQDPLAQARTLLLQAQASIQTDPPSGYEAIRGAVTILRSAYADAERTSRFAGINQPKRE